MLQSQVIFKFVANGRKQVKSASSFISEILQLIITRHVALTKNISHNQSNELHFELPLF